MKRLLAGLAALGVLSCVPDEPDSLLAAPKRPSPNAPVFTINDVTVAENAQIATLTITKTGTARSASVVRVRTVNSSAISGVDYDSVVQDVSFSKNTVTTVVNIQITDDDVLEETETFRVVLSAGSNAVIADNTGVVTITDDDAAPAPTTKLCPDGTTVPIAQTCPEPPPPPVRCPDGTEVPAGQACPPPNPTPVAEKITTDGDSISKKWSGNWVGMLDTALPDTIPVIGLATSGASLSVLVTREPQVIAENPTIHIAQIGTNELRGSDTGWAALGGTAGWVNKIGLYFSRLQDALPNADMVFVIPPPQCPTIGPANVKANTRRREAIPMIVAQLPALGVTVVRTDLNPDFDEDNDACNPHVFTVSDGIHLTDGTHVPAGVLSGQRRWFNIIKPVVDDLLTPSPESTLVGLAPIASNFDISLGYTTSTTIPPSAGIDVVGAFRFVCGAGKIGVFDPIVAPGQATFGHLHQFYGNDSVTHNSTYASLRASGGSTCNHIGDGTTQALNRSAYWMPAMLDGTGNVVLPDYVTIYYKRRPKSDPKCSLTSGDPKAEGNCIPLPNGLKFIFGYDMLTGTTATGALSFNCSGPGAVQGAYASIDAAKANCPVGSRLGAIIHAPACWDGQNLDSANHRSHMSYQSYGNWGYKRCPPTHPYVIPAFTLSAWYTIQAGDNLSNWSLSSDAMHPELPSGSTFHADFFMAWDPIASGIWHDNCIDLKLNCSAGQLGDGKSLRGASVPFYNIGGTWKPSWTHPAPRVDDPTQ